jgi:hypothetical protein
LQRLETRAAKDAEKEAEKEERKSSKPVQQSVEPPLTQRPTSILAERLARVLPAGVTPAEGAGAAAIILALLATLLCWCCCRWCRSGRKEAPKPARDVRKGRRQRLPVDEEVGADERRHSKVRDTKRSPRNKGGGTREQLQPYVL